jgi:lipoprotein-anchoring transpeptidase ErfK/SrfK
MFRGAMPALTVVVFVIGTCIGLGWSQGLIPVGFYSARTGSISPEYSKREPLPPPPDVELTLSSFQDSGRQSDSTVDYEELIKNQSEPGLHNDEPPSPNTTSDREVAWDDATNPGSAEAPEVRVVQETPEEPRPVVRLGKRGQKAVKSNREAEIAGEAASDTTRNVVAVAHQDPNELQNDARETPRNANGKDLSPRELLTIAEEKLANGDTLKAHRDLSTIYWNHKEFRPQIQAIIDSTAKAIFFQSKPHYLDPYTVQEGERLEVIARKYHLSWEYLAKLNRTNPKRIQVGQKLKVIKGPFGAVVDLEDFALTIHLQGYYVKRYEIGIGKDNSSPSGEFAVLNKVENPEYTDSRTGKTIKGDDPTNPLGKRWLDLGDSYGIHGTIDPQSIGKAESRGCIRLADNDIIEVYDFLVKGSKVVLR